MAVLCVFGSVCGGGLAGGCGGGDVGRLCARRAGAGISHGPNSGFVWARTILFAGPLGLYSEVSAKYVHVYMWLHTCGYS